MNACILCVGKLKEKWQAEGVNEYLKRLSRYGKYEIIQIDDIREPENASPAQIRQIMDKEGKAILLLHADDIDKLIDILTENKIRIRVQ